MKKDYTDLIIFVSLFFMFFMFVACDSGWSVGGYEV